MEKTMSELNGKVCLVTGGAGHIGRAICEALLSHGAEVIAVGRREPAMPIAHNEKVASFLSADIRDATASQAVIDTIEERYGRLDILINNAGGGPPVAAAQASPELTQKIVSLNLLAPLVLSQQAHSLLERAIVWVRLSTSPASAERVPHPVPPLTARPRQGCSMSRSLWPWSGVPRYVSTP